MTWFDYHNHLLDGDAASLGITVNIVTLALTATMVVALQRRIRRIGKIANHDALTGAMTRSALQSAADQMIERSKSEGTSVTVGVIDCNGFKRINDVRGHHVGDEVLVMLAQAFDKALGRHGVLGRVGGDEFVFVIQDRTEPFVNRMIEHAREVFAELIFGLAPLCTFSVGTARLGGDGESYGELVNTADARMYREKSALDTVRAAVRIG